MGLYKTVLITCPECHDVTEAQSKAGPEGSDIYEIEDAPLDILIDLQHQVIKCHTCQHYMKIQLVREVRVI